ncbi:MAG: hypothetical protein LC135_15440 [Phycisphaerae bacterium]|nr:hypothetical protein [Phycisphaerae bacterium]MCZ2401234.1 hypothetical protein [Phycisphaerae bacterium]
MGTFADARLQKSRGAGTFGSYAGFSTESYGVSIADWDNDGDIDFTAGETFWRNMLLERFYESPASSLWQQVYCLDDGVYDPVYSACPAWADVDRDGDLDCARGAHTQQLGSTRAKFQRNYLYHGGTCADCEPLKRYVNVRPVRAAPDNGPNGWRDNSECEFGAFVELVVRNHPDPNMAHLRRVQFTSTTAGYLNQDEYPPHFGLPGDPDPNDPDEDLRLDVYVDFLARGDEPNAGSGVWRVDWTVNAQLANINLADLYVDCNDPDPETLGRPITVYRDGRVRFKGADPNVAPSDPNLARLYTLGGRLTLPSQGGGALPGLTTGNVFAGVRFNKEPNSPELRIREIIVDGQLDQTTSGCDYNVVVLDVTDPNNPSPVGGLKAYTFSDNRRTFIHVPPQDPNDPDFVLPEGDGSTTRKYEVRVRLTSYRMNTLPDLTGLQTLLGLTVDKGLRTESSSGKNVCTEGMDLGSAATTPVTIRLSPTGN